MCMKGIQFYYRHLRSSSICDPAIDTVNQKHRLDPDGSDNSNSQVSTAGLRFFRFLIIELKYSSNDWYYQT